MQRLMALRDGGADLLGERLRSPDTVEEIVRRQLLDLDSDRFAVRESASQKLKDLGMDAAPVLRQALKGKPSLEMRRRVEELLVPLTRFRRTWVGPLTLREIRAV